MIFFADIVRPDLALFEERVDNIEIGLAAFVGNALLVTDGIQGNRVTFHTVDPGQMVDQVHFVVKANLPVGTVPEWTGTVWINGAPITDVAMYRKPRPPLPALSVDSTVDASAPETATGPAQSSASPAAAPAPTPAPAPAGALAPANASATHKPPKPKIELDAG